MVRKPNHRGKVLVLSLVGGILLFIAGILTGLFLLTIQGDPELSEFIDPLRMNILTTLSYGLLSMLGGIGFYTAKTNSGKWLSSALLSFIGILAIICEFLVVGHMDLGPLGVDITLISASLFIDPFLIFIAGLIGLYSFYRGTAK